MKYSWRIARIFGIDIKIDSSWLVIFVLFSWSLAGSYFPGSHPHWSLALRWAMGVLTSLFVFGSVLAHELTHSIVAIKQGETVKSITLFILGGVAQISEEPKEPLKEFSMAIVGPLSSFFLAVFFFSSLFFCPPLPSRLGLQPFTWRSLISAWALSTFFRVSPWTGVEFSGPFSGR